MEGNIYDVVVAGLGEKGVLLSEYYAVGAQLNNQENQVLLERLHVLQNKIDILDAWPAQQQVESILSRMQLDPSKLLSSLSGGVIRRVLLAKALVSDPDILLLDEPTNHLDISTIEWLEEFLVTYKKTLIFITHDRSLLKRVATQIVEVEHGEIQTWNCDYTQYLQRKAIASEAKLKSEQLFDKRLAEEEKWIRKGIQARRTRNEGRVRKLFQMRKEKQQRREQVNKISLKEQRAHYSGKIVFDIQDLTYQHNTQFIIKGFSMKVVRGDKIGIIGGNGCGKTTFLKLLLEQLSPTDGKILRGTQLDYCYFDQQRQQLNEEKSVLENISDAGEYVTFNGKSQHIISYLRDFLFTPQRARTPVKDISGGERNRLLLARIFMKSCNLLILDEPTNDLDTETLELLEECLVNYSGTLLLVSHDREFVNNIVTSTLVFSGKGDLTEYVGDYDDYLRQSKERNQKIEQQRKVSSPKLKKKNDSNKLSFKDKYELEQLPKKIEVLEAELNNLQLQMNNAEFYKEEPNVIASTKQHLVDVQNILEQSYARWELLEQ